jgi:hypothetical protein
MTWTTPADLRAQVLKLWNKGALPASVVGGEVLFPRRMILRGPTSTELAREFVAVRDWIAALDREAKYYRVVRRTVNHRVLGANAIPAEIWVDTQEDALNLIGKRRDGERLAALAVITGARQPDLIRWLQRRPLRALEIADDWPHLLEIVAWLQDHPRPGIYLRQVDIPGVHSKFIEAHRAVLAELFDLTLPPAAVDVAAGGLGGFCRRYGFRDKPVRVRLRLLDPDAAQFATGTDQDITVTHDTFAHMALPAQTIFITENEINFLAFPAVTGGMVIFGAGYGFDMLAQAAWLHERAMYYWGDIDTHGFAILDQLRAHFPHCESFLMDRPTLMAHQQHWGVEPRPEMRELDRLNNAEKALYDDLRHDSLGRQVRLEQERIGFAWVQNALAARIAATPREPARAHERRPTTCLGE